MSKKKKTVTNKITKFNKTQQNSQSVSQQIRKNQLQTIPLFFLKTSKYKNLNKTHTHTSTQMSIVKVQCQLKKVSVEKKKKLPPKSTLHTRKVVRLTVRLTDWKLKALFLPWPLPFLFFNFPKRSKDTCSPQQVFFSVSQKKQKLFSVWEWETNWQKRSWKVGTRLLLLLLVVAVWQ